MSTKKEIYDYLEQLVSNAEKYPDGICRNDDGSFAYDAFERIWDKFWVGVNKLRELGLRAEYCDPDADCRDDILACWNAYRSINKDDTLGELLNRQPWS